MPRGRKPTPAHLRVYQKVDKRGPMSKLGTRCWVFLGAIKDDGYGITSVVDEDGVRRERRPHIVTYMHRHGLSTRPTLTLDHRCHNRDRGCVGGKTCQHRRCVRPSHLRLVTAAANVRAGRAGQARAAQQRAKTQCPKEHAYDQTNTIIRNGKRECRTCRNDRARENRRLGLWK